MPLGWTLHVLLLLIAIVYFVLYKENEADTNKSFTRLFVGVLSARENFKQRQSLRSTWLQSKNFRHQGDVQVMFIIGNESCRIPPPCQKSRYTCEKGITNISAIAESFYTCSEIVREECMKNENIFHQGYSFQVHHPVVITKLGVYSKLLSTEGSVQISVRDLHTKEVVVNTSITQRNFDVKDKGYIYRFVENFLLPKEYRGLLLVEGSLIKSLCSSVKWNSNGEAITFERIFLSSDVLESIRFSENLATAPSIGFQVIEMGDLNEKSVTCSSVSHEWDQYVQEVEDQLNVEQKLHDDILFVDVIDTYRGLPTKLLIFYDWLVGNVHFDYFLKTDDDCVLDIDKVMKALNENVQFDPGKLWIWSRFRSRWPVNYVGKWADYDYKSPVYPMFPCGAAYVLSQKTVYWLQSNKNHLFPYQGEDVSLGIWLAAVNPSYMNDERWECDDTCSDNSLNRAQLHLDDVARVWALKNQCGNLCTCKSL